LVLLSHLFKAEHLSTLTHLQHSHQRSQSPLLETLEHLNGSELRLHPLVKELLLSPHPQLVAAKPKLTSHASLLEPRAHVELSGLQSGLSPLRRKLTVEVAKCLPLLTGKRPKSPASHATSRPHTSTRQLLVKSSPEAGESLSRTVSRHSSLTFSVLAEVLHGSPAKLLHLAEVKVRNIYRSPWSHARNILCGLLAHPPELVLLLVKPIHSSQTPLDELPLLLHELVLLLLSPFSGLFALDPRTYSLSPLNT
jgi:hypothetical protein